jgi:signal transduction histidine kinase/cell division protein FtsL
MERRLSMHTPAISKRTTVSAALAFGALGLAGNWLSLHLFFNINIYFGSLFVMVALLRYGTRAGVLAAAIAGSYTWAAWHHPWTLVILVGEAWFVGRMLKRSQNLVFLDTLYWFCIGMPLTELYQYFLLHTDLSLATLLTLKQGVNGILNALFAALLLHIIGFMPFAGRQQKKLPSMHQVLVTTMVAAILIPAISYVDLDIRRDIAQEELQVRQQLNATTDLTRQLIETWLADKTNDVQTLASMVGDPQSVPSRQIQEKAELIKRVSPHFVKMSVQNSRAVSVAFVPAVDEQGRSNVGKDYSTMPYHRLLRETLRPVVSDIDYGTVSKGPRLALFAPIIINGEFRGYCTGVVETSLLLKQLQIISQNRSVDITLLDRKRQVIASTNPGLRMMERLEPRQGGELHWLADKVYQVIPRIAGKSDMRRLQEASFGMDSPLNNDVPWSIVIAMPMKSFRQILNYSASRGFALMLCLVVFAIAAAQAARAAFVHPVARLEQLSATLPAELIRHQEMQWPESGIREIAGLIGNFRQMAATLASYVSELQSLNESLEQRVAERTEEILRLNEELEERVRTRTEELESALRHMESFSYSISHDLRSPLRAVNGYAEILREDFGPSLPPEAHEYLGKMSGNVTRMGDLIDDLLTFSRLNRKPLLIKSVDVAALARKVLEELEVEREGRTIEVIIGDLPSCPADPSLLKQVFANLIGNALKYSRRREKARIELGSFLRDDSPVYFVRDNGEGFDMAYAVKLFGVFQRLHSHADFEGTGVGLAIVHNIISRHGGRVWAEAEVGKGATFFFTLPPLQL